MPGLWGQVPDKERAMLITNGRIVTLGDANRIIEGGALRVDGALIADVGDAQELEKTHPDEERMDAGGQLVLPASICAHTHFYGAFARGMSIPGAPAESHGVIYCFFRRQSQTPPSTPLSLCSRDPKSRSGRRCKTARMLSLK